MNNEDTVRVLQQRNPVQHQAVKILEKASTDLRGEIRRAIQNTANEVRKKQRKSK